MPKIAKEKEVIIDTKKVTKKDVESKNLKETSKKSSKKSENIKVKKNTNSTKSSATKSKSTSSSKNSKTSSNTSRKMNSKSATTKSSTAKSITKKRTQKKAVSSKKLQNTIPILEYYDLPYKYGNTLIKLLAQTPKTLFVYWEISDIDISNFKEQFGEDFFYITKPILIVHNLTKNKTHEVEINDFANCWYLTTEEPDCEYDIELARKFIKNTHNMSKKENDYLYIAKSNNMQSPNDHILFEKLSNFVIFKNVETGDVIKKSISSFKSFNNLYKFYKDIYKNELLNNPSSNFFI